MPKLRLDREMLELLRHDPELLAIADAIAATQRRDGEKDSAMPEPLRTRGFAGLGAHTRAAESDRFRG